MKTIASRWPLAFSIAAILVAELGMAAMNLLFRHATLSRLAAMLVIEACFCTYVAWLLSRLHWWRDAGFLSRLNKRSILTFTPWLLLIMLLALEGGRSAAGGAVTATTAAFTLMVGFAEEGLLRGVSLRALLPGGAMRAAFLSSLIFGLAHLLNIAQGRDVLSSIVQMVYATFLGIGFCGARLYAGSIWPVIFIHALIDFADLAGRDLTRLKEPEPMTVASAVTPIVITGLYAIYGVWLIHKYKRSRS